ncbi:MAG TPA: SagB family peptide dehydrogenase [Blastocatellia bacterium]|nr:SagB family peptide dehydrogenase [Blastocatellia bacterium]
MSNQDTSQAWNYHNLTKHSYWSVRRNAHYLDWANMPNPFKIYPDIEPVRLPQELPQTGLPTLEALASVEVERPDGATPTLEQLASILFYSAGVTKKKVHPGGTIYFRAAACAGALYPIETYVVCGDLQGLAAGVYHFNPGDFSLRRLREGDQRGALVHASAGNGHVAAAPVTLVSSAISWRSAWKYQNRAYRYHFWDNGTILANALALATAHRLPASIVMGFVDAEINRLIGIDGEQELALSLLALGHEVESVKAASVADLPELNLQTIPLSAAQVDYPLIHQMHHASELANQEEARAWRGVSMEKETPAETGEVIPLAIAERLPGNSLEEVIQRRASTRRFARKPLPFADLSSMLDRATRGIPADFLHPAGAQWNDIYLIVNRVEGLEPGAYFYRRQDRALERLKSGDFSQKATYLALEQELAGDASATLFFMADLEDMLKRFGNRGYRAAQMEAGIIGGKVYLATYALSRGATGLTFYDDDVTEFFSPHAAGKSCIFVTSVGIPGKRPIY